MGVITGNFNLSLLEKGSKGAKLRTRVWTEGDTHLEGKEGEDFYDVVRYKENNQLYLCIKTVGAAAKMGVNDPVTSIQKHLGFWAVAQNWEFVATKLLLAEKITADMINANGIVAKDVDVTGKITATSGDITNVTVGSIWSKNNNFSIDEYGYATVIGLTSSGGTFDQLTATDGTFTRGTFTNISANGGAFVDISASGGNFNNITATGGTFTDITATGGTFTDISAEGGMFNNITSDGGTFTNVDVTGKITATSGSIDNVTVSSITSKNGNFSIDANGDATVTNITATGGTFIQGTFENITLKKSINTASDNLYIDANGNVSVQNITSTNGMFTGGTFTNITATGGTFNDINAEGGTFNNITSDGGTFTNVTATKADITGKITASTGTIGGLTISKNSLSNANISTKPKLCLMNNELSFYKIFKVDTDARDTFVTIQANDTNAVQVTTSAGHLGLYIGSTNGGSFTALSIAGGGDIMVGGYSGYNNSVTVGGKTMTFKSGILTSVS